MSMIMFLILFIFGGLFFVVLGLISGAIIKLCLAGLLVLFIARLVNRNV